MKIGDIATDIFSGGTPNTQNPEYWGGALPWLSSGETRNRIIVKTEKTITPLGVSESSTRRALKHDIVIASAGQGTTRGRVSYSMIDTYINQSVIAIRVDPHQVEPIWLFYNLYNRYEELRRLSDANASRGSITTKLIRDLEVKLPSLEEQKTISPMLELIERRIIGNNRMNETLESIGQRLFTSFFTDEKIVRVKSLAIEEQSDPEVAAIKELSGREPAELQEQILTKVRQLVNRFPFEFEADGKPRGWR
ncbi:MAG TPA: restriction endonuclease subunit S [Candidatus Angelobacter sp.]|nr:restriction endonuclease subunit S [Candidatus Angelobacter sp.]